MTECHVAVDIGASSGRVIAGALVDGRVVLREMHRFPNGAREVDGHLVWDLDGLWDSILEGLVAVREAGMSPVSIGIDTWAVDFVLLDADGRRIGDAVSYRDARTEGVREELEESGVLSFEEHYARTGIQFQRFNTAYQLRALMREHPGDLASAKLLLMVPDYLNYLLTGIAATEYSNASTTALVGARSRDWDDELIDRLGLPRGIFLPISEPGTILGRLRPEIAARVGFDCDVVLPCTHDTGSAWLAVPARDERSAFLSSGTWSLLGMELDRPLVSPEAEAANLTNEGGYAGTYRCLRNTMGLWMIQRVRTELAEAGNDLGWAELVDLSQEARATGYSAIVDADDARFLVPDSMLAEIRSACEETDQQAPSTAGEYALVVYDSLAAAYAKSLALLADLSGREFSAINIVGGGSANGYLNQATADACGPPVFAGPMEGTALGNVLAQLIAYGEVADLAAARSLVKESFDIKEVRPHE